MRFKWFFENVVNLPFKEHPDDIHFMQEFFNRGMDASLVMVFSDFLSETGRDEFGQAIKMVAAKVHSEVKPFYVLYNAAEHYRECPFQKLTQHPWHSLGYVGFVSKQDMYHSMVRSGSTAYLYNVKRNEWRVYRNNLSSDGLLGVRRENPDQHGWRNPIHPVTIDDFKKINVVDVDKCLLKKVFWEVILYWSNHQWGQKGTSVFMYA